MHPRFSLFHKVSDEAEPCKLCEVLQVPHHAHTCPVTYVSQRKAAQPWQSCNGCEGCTGILYLTILKVQHSQACAAMQHPWAAPCRLELQLHEVQVQLTQLRPWQVAQAHPIQQVPVPVLTGRGANGR
jgi:hypothetical protein